MADARDAAEPWHPHDDAPVTERPVRVWDRVLTVVFLVLLIPGALTLSAFGGFISMASDPCGSNACSYGLIEAGYWIGVIGPWVVALAAAVVAVLLLVRSRLAFWVPIVAGVLMVATLLAGAAIASSGVST